MIIKNGMILNDEFKFINADVELCGDEIKSIRTIDGEGIDATDCYVVPGFIDTHFHGAMNTEFLNPLPNAFDMVSTLMAKNGTTSIVPALSANPKEKMLGGIDYLLGFMGKEKDNNATILGVHLEGPFFSLNNKGAHLPENIRKPDVSEFMEYVERGKGKIKIITMAPEEDGADDVIRAAVKNNVTVSIGHTVATMDEVFHAVEVGATQGTHTFNAMKGLNHREPGTVGGILFSDAKAELICDFFHVHPKMIKMVYDLKGAEKINLVTDSVFANGMEDGEVIRGNRKYIIKDNHVFTEDGTISGSTICLIDAVRNLVSIGITLEEACMMASKNPAESVGEYGHYGSITAGKSADLVILDKNLEIKHVILRGKLI